MSAKSVINPFKVVDAQSMTTEVISLPTAITSQDNVAYQVTYSGSPTGSFNVEATLDGTTWSTLVFSPAMTAANSASPFLININQVPYAQLRLKYTPSSGTGTMTAIVMAKRLGG